MAERVTHHASAVGRWRQRNGLVQKLTVSLAGYRAALARDKSVGVVLGLTLFTVAAGAALHHWVEVAGVLLAAGLLLVTELMNTALEELCDFVMPGRDARIGRIKDIASAAVLTAFIVWLAVLGYELTKVVTAAW